MNIFSRIGIPQEILSDRGSQFVSDLMREISRLLSVRQLQATPYHAQCNGLVERWNGTLRRMIQKMAAEKPSDVVGCGCCSSCNKGVTFHTFPKSGKNNETDEWRRRLINAVSRVDKSFNPDRALICSRHFEDSCFVPHGKPCLLYSHNLCVKHM